MSPKYTAILQLALLTFAVGVFLSYIHPNTQIAEIAPPGTIKKEAYFPEITLEARSVYVYDVKNKKVLYEKDAELQWPLASLTKLMSAVTASELLPSYHDVKITSRDLREEGDTGLRPDEVWNIENLIDFSLIVSSNDGMRAIASVAGATATMATSSTSTPEELFVKKMNENAHRLGLRESYYLNQSGLDVSSTLSGGYGSAKDMALLLEYILRTNPHLVEGTSYKDTKIDSKNAVHEAINTNKAINDIPNVIASKTGYTDLSGGNLIVAIDAGINHPVIISVLGSTYEGRFKDVTALATATISYLSETTPKK